MRRIACLIGIVPFALALGACDVNIHDETPTEFTANDKFAMYPIKAGVARDTLVSADAVILTALVNNQPLTLEADQAANDWQALYPVRCRDSFTLQYRAAWTVEGLASRYKLVPQTPKTVHVVEPPLVKDVKIDTTEKSRKGWDGAVEYTFVTEPDTEISSVRIEPLSQQPADVEAAAPISVVTTTPVTAMCDTPVDIKVLSKSPHAHGALVIDTNNPSVREWRTEVEFGPQAPARTAGS